LLDLGLNLSPILCHFRGCASNLRCWISTRKVEFRYASLCWPWVRRDRQVSMSHVGTDLDKVVGCLCFRTREASHWYMYCNFWTNFMVCGYSTASFSCILKVQILVGAGGGLRTNTSCIS
jgi:hypothetical protein